METRVIGGIEIAYHAMGNTGAKPIVLIHGLTASASDWRQTAGALVTEGWRVLSPDCPGHGSSAAPRDAEAYSTESVADVLHMLAEALGWEPAVIVGNSMGGAIAQEYAIRHPGSVMALVLVDSAGDLRRPLPKPTGHHEFVELERALAFEQGMAAVWDLHQERRGWLYSGNLSPQAQAWRRQRILAVSPEGYIYGDRALGDRRKTLPDLARLRCRTLVVCCENEEEYLREVSEDLTRTIPAAQYEVIPRAWHQPHLENPVAFIDVLLRFLESL